MIPTNRVTSIFILLCLGAGLLGLLSTPRPTFGGTEDPIKEDPVAQQLPKPDVDTVANEIMKDAADLRKKGRQVEAIAAYADLITQQGVSTEIVNRARLEKTRAAIEKAVADEKAASEKSAALKEGTAGADAAAQQIMETAARLRERERFTEAISAYAEVMALPDISPQIKALARTEKHAATLEKVNAENPGVFRSGLNIVTAFWGTSTKALVTLALWGLVLAIAFGILKFSRNRAPVRENLLVDLQDLSATDRDNGSRLLSSEIEQALSGTAESGEHELFESMKDFEGAGSASIRPMVELPGLETIAATTSPIAIGPIQFTPATLLTLFRSFRQPRYQQTLSGRLLTQGNRTVLKADLSSLSNNRKSANAAQIQSWYLAQEDSDARQGVIRKLVARVMILQANKNCVTANPASMEAILEGIDRLRASAGRNRTAEMLRETIECFQTALSHDPGNWVALFNLSALQRQLGHNEFAIHSCEMLETMISQETQEAGATQKSEVNENTQPLTPSGSPKEHDDEAIGKAGIEGNVPPLATVASPPPPIDKAATKKAEIETTAAPPDTVASVPPPPIEEAATKNNEIETTAAPPHTVVSVPPPPIEEAATKNNEIETTAAPPDTVTSPPPIDEAATKNPEIETTAAPPDTVASVPPPPIEEAATKNNEIETTAAPPDTVASPPPPRVRFDFSFLASWFISGRKGSEAPQQSQIEMSTAPNSKTIGTATSPRKSFSLRTYVEKHPLFIHYVRYNRALALSKIADLALNKKAVELLDDIVNNGDETLNSLAKSAKAAALLFQVTKFSEDLDQARKARSERERRIKNAEPQAEVAKAIPEQPAEANGITEPAKAVQDGQSESANSRHDTDTPGSEKQSAEPQVITQLGKAEQKVQQENVKAQGEIDQLTSEKQPADASIITEQTEVGNETQPTDAKPQRKSDEAGKVKQTAEARLIARLDKVENEILKISKEIEALKDQSLKDRGELHPSLALACAVALNAKGFVFERKDWRKESRLALEAASALQPGFVEPHINLARLYRHGQQKVAADWVVRAQRHLEQALSLQPENRDANYQMGRLLSSEAMLRYADALAAFAKAAPHGWAAYWASEIYFETVFEEGSREKGIEQLRTSIRLSPKVDFRLGKLMDQYLAAADEHCNSAINLLSQIPGRAAGVPLPIEVQKLRNRAGSFLYKADLIIKRMAKGDHQLESWSKKGVKRSAAILKKFPS